MKIRKDIKVRDKLKGDKSSLRKLKIVCRNKNNMYQNQLIKTVGRNFLNSKINDMYLKQFDKKGNKYYINAFTGVTVNIPTANPLKREPNTEIQQMMFYSKASGFGSDLKLQILNNQKTIFIGEFKRFMKMKPEERDEKEFIIACKRVNINPWPMIIEKQATLKPHKEIIEPQQIVKQQKSFRAFIKIIINLINNLINKARWKK